MYGFITPEKESLGISLYSPIGEYIHTINNTIELIGVRSQIIDKKLGSGYYLMFIDKSTVFLDNEGDVQDNIYEAFPELKPYIDFIKKELN